MQCEGTMYTFHGVRPCVQGIEPNSVTFATLLTRQNEQGRLDLVRPTLEHMHQVNAYSLYLGFLPLSLLCYSQGNFGLSALYIVSVVPAFRDLTKGFPIT